MSDEFEIAAPEIKTDRLLLRPLAVDDTAAIFAYASDPEVARFTLWPPHKSPEFTARFVALFRQPIFLSWAICELGSPSAIGMIFFHSQSKQHRKAEIAFNLAKSHWRKGYISEAAAAVVAFGFRELKFNRIEATSMPGNVGSRRVLEKVGFRHEGTMRQSHLRYDGPKDMDLLATLVDDPHRGQIAPG